jgi:hypothetical protein
MFLKIVRFLSANENTVSYLEQLKTNKQIKGLRLEKYHKTKINTFLKISLTLLCNHHVTKIFNSLN